jgi:hypothetical protein
MPVRKYAPMTDPADVPMMTSASSGEKPVSTSRARSTPA